MKNFLKAVAQFVTRITDTRRRAEYVAPCKGCAKAPVITFFDDEERCAHVTCVSADCRDPQFTSNPPEGSAGRTRAEALLEWNKQNAPKEDPLEDFGYVPIAVEGQVDSDFNVWTLEAMQAVEASNPSAYLLQRRGGVPTLYVRVSLAPVDDIEAVYYDGVRLDEDALVRRSSRSAIEQSRARPPAPNRQQVQDQQSRRPFDPTSTKGDD